MSLNTEQIIKILQLKGLGRRTAFKICDLAKNETLDSNNDLESFIVECIAKKQIQRLPNYTKQEFDDAFKKGLVISENSFDAGIKIVSFFDEDFPASLKKIPDSPLILNFIGNYKEINSKIGIAIIGTREPTVEGVKSGENLGMYFGKKSFNIVSGLAIGCDAAAHRGCLEAKGFTTAILAHGLHTIYPKENKQLAEDIVATGGVLMSEYFIGTGALANYFVERDRLQAGLSLATIVIQTDVKGGTMHAVNATIEGNKILAAVSYKTDIRSAKVKGNEMLIKQGKAFPLKSDNLLEFEAKIGSVTFTEKKNDYDSQVSVSKTTLTDNLKTIGTNPQIKKDVKRRKQLTKSERKNTPDNNQLKLFND